MIKIYDTILLQINEKMLTLRQKMGQEIEYAVQKHRNAYN